jgi:uncharacterized protein (TIGR03435 family)
MSMAELAKLLPGLGGTGIELAVADHTGLNCSWDFNLDVHLNRPDAATARQPIVDVFKIGLKLERRKVQLQGLVIDHVEP